MRPTSRSHAGFTLIEVMVALVVMAFGMLGIASLLLVSARANTSSITKQQALQSAYNVIDKIRANGAAAAAGSYNASDIPASGSPVIPAAPAVDCSTALCNTAAQIAAYDTWYWMDKDLTRLPDGAGSITTATSAAGTVVTVTVQWNDAPAASSASGVGLGATAASGNATNGLAVVVASTLL